MAQLKVKQLKSGIGCKVNQRETLRSSPASGARRQDRQDPGGSR